MRRNARNERQNPSKLRSKKCDASGLSRKTRQAPVSDRAISLRSRNGIGKEPIEEKTIDAGEPAEIGDWHALVDLMHGIAAETELDDRADALEEERVRRAASGGESRGLAGG